MELGFEINRLSLNLILNLNLNLDLDLSLDLHSDLDLTLFSRAGSLLERFHSINLN